MNLVNEMLYGPSGQLVVVGESHPRQLVWVKNGESIEDAIARQISLESVQTRAATCPQGKGMEAPFSPPRPERSHPRNRAPKNKSNSPLPNSR